MHNSNLQRPFSSTRRRCSSCCSAPTRNRRHLLLLLLLLLFWQFFQTGSFSVPLERNNRLSQRCCRRRCRRLLLLKLSQNFESLYFCIARTRQMYVCTLQQSVRDWPREEKFGFYSTRPSRVPATKNGMGQQRGTVTLPFLTVEMLNFRVTMDCPAPTFGK